MATDQLPERLPRRVRLFYASGSVSGNALSQAFSLWLIFFYAPPSDEDMPTQIPELGGLSPRVVLGIALALARVVESLDDPVVGYLTDHTRSRWGRRVPYILFATPWWVLGFFLLFVPPGGEQSILNLVWLIAVIEIHWLLSNFSGAPLEALLPHLAKRHEDRVAIAAQQLLFGIGGALVGLSLSSLLVEFIGFGAMAAIVAMDRARRPLHGAVRLLEPRSDRYDAVRGRFPAVRAGDLLQPAVHRVPAELHRLSHRAAHAHRAAAVLRLRGARRRRGSRLRRRRKRGHLHVRHDGAHHRGRAGRGPAVRAAGDAPGQGRRGPRLAAVGRGGDVPAVLRGLRAVAAAGRANATRVFFAGMPLAGVFMFPNILIADIIDDDERRTHTRREAMFYGTQNLLEKSATAFSPLIFALVLLAGDSADNPLGIRLVGPVAGVLVLLGYWSFRNYSLQPDAEALPRLLRGGSAR